MNTTKHYRLDRRSRARLAAIWKHEYDELARFNSEKAHGIVHEPEFIARMAAVQSDYDENYLSSAKLIWASGKKRRVW